MRRSATLRALAALALALLLAAPLAACGKKGDLDAPEDKPSTWPRTYPRA